MKPLEFEKLTIEQKIGLLITVRGVRNEEDRAFLFEMLRKKAVGGVQVSCVPGCDAIIKEIKEAAGYPILIGADMEKGFPLSDAKIPSVMSLAAAANEELAYQFGAATAIEAKRYGFNMVWGPVVDLIEGDCLCCIPRTFGDDKERTASLAAAIMRGYRDNGMFFTAKHYPGGRDMVEDTHMVEGKSMLTEADLVETDLYPYLYAMEHADLPGVMTGHVRCVEIDPVYPATLSAPIISILRQAGFDGLIITDSFAMMGILQKFGEEKIYGLAIAAGNDMVLPNYRISFKEAYDYMYTAYETGVISPARLDEAVKRVLKAQELTMQPARYPELSDAHREALKQVARDGICAITDPGVSCKLDDGKKRQFVILSENMYVDDGGETYEITDPGSISRKDLPKIEACIKEHFPDAVISVISQFPSRRQNEKVCYASTKVDELIFITYVTSDCYQASESLTKKVVNLMNVMGEKRAAHIHLGNPFALQDAPHFPRRIACFGAEDSVTLAIQALAGTFLPKGEVPVKLNLQ